MNDLILTFSLKEKGNLQILMKIDGKLIASKIKADLKKKIALLKKKNIIPHLAVVLIGNDPSSEVYVKQKLKVGEEIGAKVTLFNEHITYNKEQLISLINKQNKDNKIHGIIIQRPVPIEILKEELDLLVDPQKDVDGFHPKSPFSPPIASAVLKILEWVFCHPELVSGSHGIPGQARNDKLPFSNWLKKQKILVIGRGETAGKPIAETLQKMGIKPQIAHSKTTQLDQLVKLADIIITCVGRSNIVRHSMITNKTTLIGVGLHQENGKLVTDYNQEEIAEKVAFYTPVPGGVGPVNVACLFENLVSVIKLLK